MTDTTVVATALKLKRFVIGKSTTAKTQAEAYNQQSAFCKDKGGRLPTLKELCPKYNESKGTSPALGCEKALSWVPYAGSTENWMYIGCVGAARHHLCMDHMAFVRKYSLTKSVWVSGDLWGEMLDCMVPDMTTTTTTITTLTTTTASEDGR